MTKESKHSNIELRSEEVQDILNRPPSWMIKWGNTVLIAMVIMALLLSYFIKYPDVIIGKATISTDIPPAFVVSNVNGRIGKVLKENGETVLSGEILAELINPIPTSSINYLDSLLSSASSFVSDSLDQTYKDFEAIDFYEATGDVINLLGILEEYHFFLFNESSFNNLHDLESKLNANLRLETILKREVELSKIDIENAREKFKMEEQEYKLGYVTKLNFLNAQSTFNQSLKTEENIKRSIIQMEITINDLKSQISNFRTERQAQKMAFLAKIRELIVNLENYIVRWKTEFTIKAPISGRVDYSGRIKTNQLISSGDRLFAIIPPTGNYETVLDLPAQGFGKVEVGQEVKLKLDNYPYNEYGFVNGRVSKMASLPKEDTYQVEVILENALTSSYNIDLEYSPEMTATAEVITKDLRLIERLFNSLRSIFDN